MADVVLDGFGVLLAVKQCLPGIKYVLACENRSSQERRSISVTPPVSRLQMQVTLPAQTAGKSDYAAPHPRFAGQRNDFPQLLAGSGPKKAPEVGLRRGYVSSPEMRRLAGD